MNNFIDKSMQFQLHQDGGDILLFSDPEQFAQAKRAMRQSLINCRKTLKGGGFNPNSKAEKIWVETGKWPEEK